ncbi:ring u-box domain-containing protein [Moniliophthora roreri]|uniref:RING-type domain-containing protein n=1 Tax=Moniliophthora roreri TaxID=221103 RepID=A0A0W0G5Q3_MONRR|nr:ring u-box domain-containing protein [Moniliophthora roreri]
MSSNPPQLHLTLPANTTSFKRSFDQFGFDLESPVGSAEAGSHGAIGASSSNSRSERNKRARSASSLSDGNNSTSSTGSSTLGSSSSGSIHSERSQGDADLSAPSTTRAISSNILGAMPFEPPRLPTPDIQDIEMPDYPLGDTADEPEDFELHSSSSSPPAEGEPVSEDSYRSPHQRIVDAFSPAAVLRSSRPRSPIITRLPTPPPTLPPLSLQDDSTPLHENVIPFLNSRNQPSSRSDSPYEFGSPPSTSHVSRRPVDTVGTRNGLTGLSLDISVQGNLSSSSLSLSSTRSSVVSPVSDDSSAVDAPLLGHSASVNPHSQPQSNAESRHPRFTSISDTIISDARLLSDDDLSSLGLSSTSRTSPEQDPASVSRPSDPLPHTSVRPSRPALPGSHRSAPSIGSGNSERVGRPSSPLEDIYSFYISTPTWRREHHSSSAPRNSRGDRHVWDSWDQRPIRPRQRIQRNLGSNVHPSRVNGDDSARPSDDGSFPLTLRRQPSLGSLSTEFERWFEDPDTRHQPPSYGAQPEQVDRASGISSYYHQSLRDTVINARINATTQEPRFPTRRATASHLNERDFDFESTVPGLRASLFENGVPQQDFPSLTDSAVRTSRPQSPSPLASMLAREELEGQGASVVHSRTDPNRRLYIEQGLVDPREATGRYRLRAYDAGEEARSSPVRWGFYWTELSDELEEDDHLSESERIYQMSRRMGPSVPRPLQPSDRDFSQSVGHHSTTLPDPPDIVYGRRIRPHYASGHGASNSLLSENSAEIRRRHDREMVDRLRRSSTMSTSQEFHADSEPESNVSNRSSLFAFGRRPFSLTGESSRPVTDAVQPPLPRRYRSPSPPSIPSPIADILGQSERRILNEEEQSASRPSRNIRRNSLGSLSHALNHRPISPSREWTNDLTSRLSDSYLSYDTSIPPLMAHRDRSMSRERRYRANSRSPPRPNPDSRVSWSSGSRMGRSAFTSAGIFDSQSSSISDIARTIAREREPSASALSDLESSLERRMRRESESQRLPPVNPPSIPPPDLGDTLFDSNDISPDLTHAEFVALGDYTRPAARSIDADADMEPPRRRSPSPLPDLFDITDWIALTASTRPPRGNDAPQNSAAQPTTERHGNIDLQSYAPGLYRNTLQRFMERNRPNERSHPPTIPPLPFEAASSSLDASASDIANTLQERSHNRSDYFQPQRSRPEPPQPYMNRRPPVSSQPARPLPSVHFGDETSHNHGSQQRTDDLHRLITSQARIGVPGLEPLPEIPRFDSANDSREIEHALHVLRQDGQPAARTQQIIERYRRERSGNDSNSPAYNNASRSNNLWGTIEENGAGDRTVTPQRAWRRVPAPRVNTGNASNNTVEADEYMTGLQPLRRRPAGTSPTRHEMQDTRPQPPGRARSFVSRFSRHRPHLDFDPDFVSLQSLVNPRRRGLRGFSFGDFIRDEDFDTSYESLITLEAALGEVKSKATPQHIIEGLETADYREWATDDSDKRCPICLDDYKSSDPVSKLPECSHWLHKPCLEQWLKGASTCPVCRESVRAQGTPSSPPPRFHSRRRDTNARLGTGSFGNSNASAGPSNSTSANGRRNSTENPSGNSNGGNTARGWRLNRSNSNWRHTFGPRPPPDSNA